MRHTRLTRKAVAGVAYVLREKKEQADESSKDMANDHATRAIWAAYVIAYQAAYDKLRQTSHELARGKSPHRLPM